MTNKNPGFNLERHTTHDLYLPTNRTPDRLIVVAPGWLGDETLSERVEEAVTQDQDLAVALVRFGNLSFGEPESMRLHNATKSSVRRTDIAEVEIVDHSMGHKIAGDAIAYQLEKKPKREQTYKVVRLVSVDGAGSNGSIFSSSLRSKIGRNVASMVSQERIRNGRLKTFGRSSVNFARSPFISPIQGAKALFFDSRYNDDLCQKAGIELSYVFHEDDFVVCAPSAEKLIEIARRAKVDVLPGDHLSFVDQQETLTHALAA